MDPFSPETWKHHWEAFIAAPFVLLPLLSLAIMVGWWIGNRLAGARVEGLSGTIENLKANIAVLEARLEFAADREADVQRARTELEKQVLELKAEVAAGASTEKLSATSAKVGAAISQFATANNALADALAPENLEPQFFAKFEQRFPGQSDKLRAFITSLKPLGLEAEFAKSLYLRLRTANGLKLSVGTIEPGGSVWLVKTATDARDAGHQLAGERYLETIASLSSGSIKRYENGSVDVRGPDGRALRLPSLIEKAPEWKEAIVTLISDTSKTGAPN